MRNPERPEKDRPQRHRGTEKNANQGGGADERRIRNPKSKIPNPKCHVALALAVGLLAGGSPAPARPGDKTPAVVHEDTGCIIYPLREVVVSSQASGVIDKMPVDEQDVVKAGDLIAQLDDTLARLTVKRLRLIVKEEHSLNEAKIRLDQAREDYNRDKRLYAKGALAPAVFQATERKYELARVIVRRVGYQKSLAEIELKQAEKRLENHRICAPIDGVVLTKHREKGESVDHDTQTPVVTLIDVSRLRAKIMVPVAKTVAVRLNQSATVTCDVFPDKPLRGRVAVIRPVVAAGVNRFEVKVEFTDPSGQVRPGMRATVKILQAE